MLDKMSSNTSNKRKTGDMGSTSPLRYMSIWQANTEIWKQDVSSYSLDRFMRNRKDHHSRKNVVAVRKYGTEIT